MKLFLSICYGIGWLFGKLFASIGNFIRALISKEDAINENDNKQDEKEETISETE